MMARIEDAAVLPDEHPRLHTLLMAAVANIMYKVVRVAGTHWTAILALETNPDDAIRIDLEWRNIGRVFAMLARDVVAEAPARVVAICTLRIEARVQHIAVLPVL